MQAPVLTSCRWLDLHWHPPAAVVVAAVESLDAGTTIAVDADGTLWNLDIGDEVVRLVGTHESLLPAEDVDRYFCELAHDHNVASLFSAQVVELMRERSLQEQLRAAIEPKLQIRRYLVEALQAALRRGVEVHVVSGSPVVALEPPLSLIDLPATSVIGAEQCSDGSNGPMVVTVGQGKVSKWRAQGLPAPDLALGDTIWDLPMLGMGRDGMMVRHWQTDPAFERGRESFLERNRRK